MKQPAAAKAAKSVEAPKKRSYHGTVVEKLGGKTAEGLLKNAEVKEDKGIPLLFVEHEGKWHKTALNNKGLIVYTTPSGTFCPIVSMSQKTRDRLSKRLDDLYAKAGAKARAARKKTPSAKRSRKAIDLNPGL